MSQKPDHLIIKAKDGDSRTRIDALDDGHRAYLRVGDLELTPQYGQSARLTPGQAAILGRWLVAWAARSAP